MRGWKIEIWGLAIAEVQALPADLRGRFLRMGALIESVGLERMREPHVKHIEGKIWEMRLSGKDGIARTFYFAATGKRVVVVRAFVKKTQKIPRSEIDLAQSRMKEWHNEQD
jgi:phage-related protein